MLKQLVAGVVVAVVMVGAAMAGPMEDASAAYQRGDYATALALWRPLAEKGDAKAQNNIGVLYEKGFGVDQDYGEAAKWYRRAAERGNEQAKKNLSDLATAQGAGTTPSPRGPPSPSGQPVKELCYLALNAARGDWDYQSLYADYAVEAKRRNLSIDDCRVAVGLPKLTPAPTTPVTTADWPACAKAENPDAIISACTRVINAGTETNENLAIAYATRGTAYGIKGDYSREIVDLDKAIQLRPDSAIAYNNRGAAYENKGDHDRAIVDLDKAIQLDPKNGYFYSNRGEAYENKGDYDRAIADFRVAARLLPQGDRGHDDALARIAEIEKKVAPPAPPPATVTPSPKEAPMFTGTGIVVSDRGQVLTNHHVIEGCKNIIVRRADEPFTSADLLYSDKVNDLALLKIDAQIAERDIAAIRIAPPVRNGEGIAVYGYPMAGTLSSSGNITGGNVSALAGPGDDISLIQLTAPIQPGNSGGPLLDQSANVIGVVNMKLDELKALQGGREFPQNVNFAIKASVAASFLEAHSVSYRVASGGSQLDLPSIADAARRFTVLIVCQ